MRNLKQNSRIVIAALVPAKGEENYSLIEKVTKNIEAAGAIVTATLYSGAASHAQANPAAQRC